VTGRRPHMGRGHRSRPSRGSPARPLRRYGLRELAAPLVSPERPGAGAGRSPCWTRPPRRPRRRPGKPRTAPRRVRRGQGGAPRRDGKQGQPWSPRDRSLPGCAHGYVAAARVPDVIPLPADDRALALGADCCAHVRYAAARAAALYGRVDLGTPKRPVRGWVFHRFTGQRSGRLGRPRHSLPSRAARSRGCAAR